VLSTVGQNGSVIRGKGTEGTSEPLIFAFKGVARLQVLLAEGFNCDTFDIAEQVCDMFVSAKGVALRLIFNRLRLCDTFIFVFRGFRRDVPLYCCLQVGDVIA
jgi:hypothetical protein